MVPPGQSWLGWVTYGSSRLIEQAHPSRLLTKFQAQILQEIRGNDNIIIAHADKNLGPVGVDTEKYIQWALKKNLLNTTIDLLFASWR
jgi:hypothetical protein